MNNVLKPSASILTKLGSLYIHIEETISNKGHSFDIESIKGILADEELQEWIKGMDKLALIPKKR